MTALVPPFSQPRDAWVPAHLVLIDDGARSPEAYAAAIDQFDVEREARYAPRDGDTFCNIFAWDVTRAMRCEVPHWVDADGHPASMGRPNTELSVNETLAWLRSTGPHPYGWREVCAVEAEAQAGNGHPTLAVWANPGWHGHIAVVRPNGPGIHIAQAGQRCFRDEPLASGFGALPAVFFTHS